MRTSIKSLLFAACLLTAGTASATHLVGGNLGYTYIGETAPGSQLYRYQVYVEFYMNCGDDSNWQFLQEILNTNGGVMPVGVYPQDPAAPNANKPLLTIANLALVDSAYIVPNLPGGCTVGAGLCTERGLLTGTVDLPLNFGGYHLYFQMNSRNLSITNLLNPNNTGIGYYAFIPPPLLPNSSPVWLGVPTPLLCINDTSTFINAATDPDGDQLIFSFEVPYNSVDNGGGIIPPPNALPNAIPVVNYVGGYSVSQPFGAGGFSFINGATGLTQYMPTVQGNYVVAVEVKEYRNGVLIGRTRRDLQLQAVVCPPNDAPEAIGAQGTSFTVQAGASLCFDVAFQDPNADSLFLTASGTIFDGNLFSPPATIIAPVSGATTVGSTFCWDTDCAQAQDQPYLFSVSVSDNGCPPRTLDVVYQVTVQGFTGPASITGSAQVCTGVAGTVYTTTALSGASYTWSVTGGAIASGQGTNSITVNWGASGPGSVQVFATNAQGCSSAPVNLPVAIAALPVANAGPDISICPGQSVALGGAPTGPAGSSYSWTPSIGLSSATAANPSSSPNTTTNYVVQVSNSGCVSRDTVMVTVNQPTVSANDDTSVCIGGTTQLNAAGTGSFTWSPTSGLSASDIADPIAAPTVTTTYVVMLTDGLGCTATDSVTVVVNPLPVVDAGLDATPCAGTNYVLGGSPSGPLGSTFAWSPSNGLSSSSAANPTLSVTNDQVFVLTVTDGNQCTTSDTITVTVLPLPDVDAGPDLQVCFGGSVQLQGSGNGSLLWTPNFGLSDPTAPDPICTPEQTTVYTLTVTDANTCTNSDQALVTVNVLPSADAGPDVSICAGGSVQIGTNQSGGFTWSPAAGLNDPNVAQPSASPGVTTTYYVTLTNASNCSQMDSVIVTVNEFDQNIALVPPTSGACENTATTIIATPDQAGNSYAWSVSGTLSITGNSGNAVDILHTTPGASTLFLVVTDDNDCLSDTISSTITTLDTPDADAGADQIYCLGDSVQIGGSPTGPVGASIAWYSPSGSIADTTSSSPFIAAMASETVIVFVSQGICVDSDTMQIIVSQVVADAGNDVAICEGSSAQLSASGGTGYSWSPGTSLSDPATSDPLATPSTTTTYTVTVTNSDQCTAVDSLVVTVNTVAQAGTDGDVLHCGSGTIFTMTDSLGGSPDVGGIWFAPDQTQHGALFDPSVDPEGQWTYVAGAGTACPDTANLTIALIVPVPSFAGDATICFGDTTQITASGGSAYSWSPNTGISDPAIADPLLYPAVTTNYTVTITDGNGCIGSAPLTITVNALPSVNAGADVAICAGASTPIGGNPTSSSAVSFTWTPGSGLNNASSANPIAGPSTTTTYSVMVQDANQCLNIDDITVTVNPLPSIDAGPDLQVCLGSSITIDATGTGSFSWSPSTGLNSTTVEDPIASPSATQTYTATLTDVNGCVAADDVTITVNTLPTVDAGEDSWLCLGFAADLIGTTSGGSAAWSPSGPVNDAGALSTSASPLITTTFTLTITDANGCVSTDAVTITVGTDPPIDAGSNTTTCQGVPVQLGGSPTSVPGSSYLWTPAIGLDDPTSPNPLATVGATTTYVLLVSNDTCTSTQPVTISISGNGQADFSARFEAGCDALRGFFLDASSDAVTWHWDFGNGITSDSRNPQAFLPYGMNSLVTLIITDASGCADTTSQLFNLDTYANLVSIDVPNVFTPNGDGQNDVFTLDTEAFLGPCTDMSVFNRWGEAVFVSQGSNITWDGRNFSGEPCTSGTYFYVIAVNGLEFKGSLTLIR